MSSPLEAAVDALLDELNKQESEVRETKRTINNLLRRMNKEPRFADADDVPAQHGTVAIRPDQFYGRPLATVAREVLEMRKQATGAEDLIKVLQSGGFDFEAAGWKDGDRLRSFTITLSKNNKAFHRLPNGMFGLPEWYPEAIKKKAQRQAEKDAGATAEDAASAPDTDTEGE